MKYLLIPIIMFTFVSCEDGSNSITVIYKKDCNGTLCICRGYSGAFESKSISIFKCNDTHSIGDTILTSEIIGK